MTLRIVTADDVNRLLTYDKLIDALADAFRADMKKVGIMTSPIDGDAVRGLIEKAAKAPADVRARFAKLLAEK